MEQETQAKTDDVSVEAEIVVNPTRDSFAASGDGNVSDGVSSSPQDASVGKGDSALQESTAATLGNSSSLRKDGLHKRGLRSTNERQEAKHNAIAPQKKNAASTARVEIPPFRTLRRAHRKGQDPNTASTTPPPAAVSTLRGLRKNQHNPHDEDSPDRLEPFQDESDDLYPNMETIDRHVVSNVIVSATQAPNPNRDIEMQQPVYNDGARISNSQLVEAREVRDDTTNLNLMLAQEVDAAELERKERENHKNKQCRRIGYALLLLSLITLLGGILGSRSRRNKVPTRSPSMAPSESPTSIPSSAPTSSLELLLRELPQDTLEKLSNQSTPQYKAYEWLLGHPELPGMLEWRKKQLFALVTFYHAMQGPNWPELIGNDWLDHDKLECHWFSNEFGLFDLDGIVWSESPAFDMDICNNQSEFQVLTLSQLNLSQYEVFIPPELSLLSSLSALVLPWNSINAPLSSFVPSQVYGMANLTELILHLNDLTGTIPTQVGRMTDVFHLSLAQANLAGKLPSEIGLWTSMQVLNLGGNSLTGAIPSEVGFMTHLEELSLTYNSLTGRIPSEVGSLTAMTKLYLDSNELSGSIPTEVGRMTNLVHIGLYKNTLTGSIPTDVGTLINMTRLRLYSNTLAGPIPTEVGRMTSLLELSMWNNSLTGSIPSEVGRMRNLTELLLQHNALTGHIPIEMGSLTSMTRLRIDNNTLTGNIPTGMGLLHDVVALDLQNNALTGEIPSELASLSSLQTVRVHYNNLSGTVPTDLCSILFGVSFDCNDQLCGCCTCPCADNNGCYSLAAELEKVCNLDDGGSLLDCVAMCGDAACCFAKDSVNSCDNMNPGIDCGVYMDPCGLLFALP